MNNYLKKILAKEDLDSLEAFNLMYSLMSGEYNDIQIASLLVALRAKGESVDEITGFVKAMREKMVEIKLISPAIDMCGTGGDSSGSFNISTTAAFIVAGAGVKVAKHGNRSMTSKSGSADVLQSLGISINKSNQESIIEIEKIGLSFLFAPSYHPAMKFAINARKTLAIRTVFNILGPLCNPARVESQAMGVFDKNITRKQVSVLKNLGSKNVMVFSGHDGLDEISTTSKTKISQMIDGNQIKDFTLNPNDLNIPHAKMHDILGGSPDKNAKIIKSILDGEKGPKRDIAAINAAAGIFVGNGKITFQEAYDYANESIDSGMALKVLKKLQK